MQIKKELVTLLLIGISALASSDKCPPIEDFPQCKCRNEPLESNSIYFGCEADNFPGTFEDFTKLLRKKKFYNITYLFFRKFSPNNRIEARTFEGFNIQKLEINGCRNFSVWADEEGGPALVGLENSLEGFWSNTGILVPRKYDNYRQEKAPSLAHLRKLKRLEWKNGYIDTFANGWFDKGPSSLEYLELSRSKIRYFGDRAFAGLTNLKKIDLTYNKFESLSRSMFPNPANHLKRMDLSYGKLKYLSDDFFTNMPSLLYVFLKHNLLTQVPENPWRQVWSQLHYLDLARNPLNCDDHIRWMVEVEAPECLYDTCLQGGLYLKKYIEREQGRIWKGYCVKDPEIDSV